jgi:hypothetical protein
VAGRHLTRVGVGRAGSETHTGVGISQSLAVGRDGDSGGCGGAGQPGEVARVSEGETAQQHKDDDNERSHEKDEEPTTTSACLAFGRLSAVAGSCGRVLGRTRATTINFDGVNFAYGAGATFVHNGGCLACVTA